MKKLPNPTIKALARLAEAMGKKLVIRFEPKPPPRSPLATHDNDVHLAA